MCVCACVRVCLRVSQCVYGAEEGLGMGHGLVPGDSQDALQVTKAPDLGLECVVSQWRL